MSKEKEVGMKGKYFWIMAITLLLICKAFETSAFALDREYSLEISLDESIYYGEVDGNTASSYRFTLEESGCITLDATAKMGAINYVIYNVNGERVWQYVQYSNEDTGEGKTHVEVNLIQGTYYFAAEQYRYSGYRTGSYSFSFSFVSAEESFLENHQENNNLFATASKIDLNTAYKGQIAENDLKDYYRFVIDESGEITLKILAKIKKIYYVIYDELGNKICGDYLKSNSITEEIRSNIEVDLIKGTYYLVLEKDMVTGCYSFELSFTSAGESFEEAISGENNNSIYTANPIVMGEDYMGQLAINDEKDYYEFTIHKSGEISINIWAKMDYIFYKISDEDGNIVWKGRADKNKITNEISTKENLKLEEGTYYFIVEKGDTGNYLFNFAKIIVSPVISNIVNTSSGIKMSWQKVVEASGYNIYRKESAGEWKKIKSVKSNTYTDNEAIKNGKQYEYFIRAYDEDGEGTESLVGTVYYLSMPTISSAKNTSSGKVTVKWKKNSKAEGYQIKYVLGSTSKTVTAKGKTTIEKKLSGLKKGKTYKIYVRNYKTVSGIKYYSAWSKAKDVKISK